MRGIAIGIAAGVVGAAWGAATPVGPFTGDVSEPLDYPSPHIDHTIGIFGGRAVLTSGSASVTSIHLIGSSTFIGDPVTPKTGGLILGFTQGPGVFEFATPVTRFGAYFDTNSGSDGAVLMLSGPGGASLGTAMAMVPAAANEWVWNGWEFDSPVSAIKVTGPGILNGFLWFEDLEVSFVPAPGVCAMVCALPLMVRRRQRCSGSGRA